MYPKDTSFLGMYYIHSYKDIQIMTYNLPAEHILELLPYVPTAAQEEAIYSLARYFADEQDYSLFLLKGYAGTGKTFLLRAIAEAAKDIGLQVEFLATTGRAAKILSQATGRPATTIHRRIYSPTSALIEEGGGYRLGKGQAGTLFIVDEASMIGTGQGEQTPFGSGNLLDDLLEYVWASEGSKLIMVGDEAQLPPVGSEFSPALSPEYLRERYGMQVYEVVLSEVVRQAEESGILDLATQLRELLEEYAEAPTDEVIPLNLVHRGQSDLRLITGEEVLDELDSCYRHYGRENVLVVTPSNKRALQHNLGIRSRILDYDSALVRGEQLLVARNNYYYAQKRDRSDFIANGELIELRRTYKHYEAYGLSFVDATIYLPEREDELEVRLLLSGLEDEQAQRSHEQRLALYNALEEDYRIGAGKGIVDTRRAVRRDPFWGALEVKYGYALTAHKAQGGQWPCVFVDLSLLGFLPTDRQMLRWLYTAVTRASERLYLLGSPATLFP